MKTNDNRQFHRGRRFLGISRAWGLAAVAVIVAVAAGACAGSSATYDSTGKDDSAHGPAASFAAAASAGPAQLEAYLSGKDGTTDGGNGTTPSLPGQNAATDQTLIVKTGQLSLEVTDIDKALAQAQTTINGMGGYVAQSSRYGEGDNLYASVTYRLPVSKWDGTLDAFHKMASKVLSEQTGTSDVSSQVVDLDARLSNLKSTESALQGIMARASAIPDVLAVEEQLSQTRSEIEQLTASRDYLKDQASMSTLSVMYQLPGKTVTTLATKDWDLGSKIDEAVAQLVKVGQGVATAAVWLVIVGVPVGLGLLIILGILWLVGRRIGRPRSGTSAS